jgi:hypothetical protein
MDVEAKLSEAKAHLEGLESGHLHIGGPFENRTEAQIFSLRRQIAEYQAIIDKRNAKRA